MNRSVQTLVRQLLIGSALFSHLSSLFDTSSCIGISGAHFTNVDTVPSVRGNYINLLFFRYKCISYIFVSEFVTSHNLGLQ